MVAEVIINLTAKKLNRTFDYEIPKNDNSDGMRQAQIVPYFIIFIVGTEVYQLNARIGSPHMSNLFA